MRKKIFIHIMILLPILGFIIAVIYLLIKNCRTSDFWSCTFFNLIQLITTIIIAIIVAHYLKNKYSDKQISKNLFIEVTHDISHLIESESHIWHTFMKDSKGTEEERIKVLLLIRKISNKISIIESQKEKFNNSVKDLISEIRNNFDEIKQTITGDDFMVPKDFTDETVRKVLKNEGDLIFKLDQIKTTIFN